MPPEKLFNDLVLFSKAQLESLDVDPLYPVLSYLHKPMEPEQALWHTLLYVGYYNIVSATVAFDAQQEPGPLPDFCNALPTGMERRYFRNGTIYQHFNHLLAIRDHYGSFHDWLTDGFREDDPCYNWEKVQANLQLPWNNGRWAGYKTAEILFKVHGYPLLPTDMGLDFNRGPRPGLGLFYPIPEGRSKQEVALMNAQGEDLLSRLVKAEVFLGIEQLETMLCDFHTLFEGRYYVGLDIDQMQEQLLKANAPARLLEPLWKARKEVLPHAYLGELHDWFGVDSKRKSHYKQTGEILVRG